MEEDWRNNYPRRPGAGSQGKSLTEWYRDKIDELTTHQQFVELWDKRMGKPPEQQGGQPVAPWQGITEIATAFGINLGELWKTREDELKALRETADAKDKEVHELRIREIDQRVQALQGLSDKIALALAQQGQGGQGGQGQPQGFLEKLDTLTQGWLSNRFTAMLTGGGGNQQTPQDPIDALIAHEEKRTKLRNFFGLGPSDGSASALAQSGIKGEILKMILEDERERLKIDKEHEVAVERNKHLGEIATVVKENLSDGVRALTMAAEEARGQGTGTAASRQKEQMETCECPHCHAKFNVPKAALAGDIGCPNCKSVLHFEEVKGGQ